MAERPLPSQQRSIISNLEKTTKLRIGTPAYLIAIPWYAGWKNAGDLDSGPINNESLLTNGNFDYQTKLEHHHFVIVTEEVWNQFHEWFGGGPPLPVNVAESKTGPAAVVRKFPINIRYGGIVRQFLFHNYMLVSELLAEVSTGFRVSASEEFVLHDFWGGMPGAPLDLTKPVRDFVFSDKQILLLDTKKADNYERTQTAPVKTTVIYRSDDLSVKSSWQNVPGVIGLTNLGNT
jgi:hypothetical protein